MRIFFVVAAVACALSCPLASARAQDKKKDQKPAAGGQVNEVAGKPFEFWIKEVHNSDRAKAVIAVKCIRQFGPEKQADALFDLLEIMKKNTTFNPVDATLRLAIAEAAGTILAHNPKYKHKDAVVDMLLHNSLKDSQYQIRIQALNSLMLLGPMAAKATDDVAAMLADKGSFEVRQTAALTLPRISYTKNAVPEAVLEKIYRALGTESSATVKKVMITVLFSNINQNDPKARANFVKNLAPIAAKDPDGVVLVEANLAIIFVLKDVPAANLKKILDLLADPDPAVRIAAVEGASKLKTVKAPTVVPALLNVIKNDKEPAVRITAIQGLGILGKFASPAVPDLIELAADKDLPTRIAAIQSLGFLGRPIAADSAKTLKPMVNDKELAVAIASILSLGKVGNATAVPYILPKLKDKELAVQMAAIQALGLLGKDGKDAVDALLKTLTGMEYKKLGETDIPVILNIVHSLGQIGDKQAAPALIKKLDDENLQIVVSAIQCLGQIGDKEATAPLVKKLNDKNLQVMASAMHALGQIGDKQAAAPLAKQLDHKNPEVVAATLKALSAMGPAAAAAVPDICGKLDDKNSVIVLYAIEALGRIGPDAKQGINRLMKLAVEPNQPELVRNSAAQAIEMISPKKKKGTK